MKQVSEKINFKIDDQLESHENGFNFNHTFDILWEQVSVQIDDRVGSQLFTAIKNKLEPSDI